MTDSDLYRQYNSNSDLRKLADKIHHSRMMSGPACAQCISMAVYQLSVINETKTKIKNENNKSKLRKNNKHG